MFTFSQDLLVHPWRAPVAFASFPACWNGPLLSFEEVILENQTALPDPLSLQDLILLASSKQIPLLGEICLLSWGPRLWHYILPCSLLSVPWTISSHAHWSIGCPQPSHHWSVLCRLQVTGPAKHLPSLALDHLCQEVISDLNNSWLHRHANLVFRVPFLFGCHQTVIGKHRVLLLHSFFFFFPG